MDPRHEDISPEELALDPHGFHRGHRGHVIVPMRRLVAVLVALLVFTVLTVGASRTETWAAATFDVDIPQWVNVSVALSIAVIKSALVVLYFMQLRYDNRLNAVIFLFCLFAFGLFLGFTTLDLGSRDLVYVWKDGELVPGGTGNVRLFGVQRVPPGPIVKTAHERFKQAYIAEHGLEAWQRLEAEHAHHEVHGPELSSADRSRPLRGPVLFGERTTGGPAVDEHAGDH